MPRHADNDNKQHIKAINGDGSDLRSPIAYKPHERDGVHMQKARLAKRAKLGADYDGASNDNIAWPLATSLVREGNTELLKTAMAYRRIHDAAKSEAKLGGHGVAMNEGFSLDRFSKINANGSVVYNRPRQKTGADIDIPAKRYSAPPKAENVDLYSNDPSVATSAPVVKNWSNIPKPWNGDKPVNDMIDAKGKLTRLRQKLGYLCEPLEMSVVDGATYQEVGNALGTANRSGSIVAGRTVVHLALITLRDAMGDIRREDIAA